MRHKEFKDYPSSNTVYGLPRSHWDKHLHNFKNPDPGLVERVGKFVSEWKEGLSPAPHLLLTGKQGRGKTHIAVGIYRYAVYQTSLDNCCYLYIPDFCVEVKRSYSPDNDNDPFEEVEACSILVLDDIFGSQLSEHETNKILARLINTAYNKNQALVVTTNYSAKEITSILHPHETSRLFQNVIHVNMTSNRDKRLK